MSKYIDLEDTLLQSCHEAYDYPFVMDVKIVLAWLDSHPEHVPRRTITESEFNTIRDEHVRTGAVRSASAFFNVATDLGITVTPNPEPTNVEKLADIYRDWSGGDEVPNSLIRFMDEAGVTAPEETK